MKQNKNHKKTLDQSINQSINQSIPLYLTVLYLERVKCGLKIVFKQWNVLYLHIKHHMVSVNWFKLFYTCKTVVVD